MGLGVDFEDFWDTDLIAGQSTGFIETECKYLWALYSFLWFCTSNTLKTKPEQRKWIGQIEENRQRRRRWGRQKINKLKENKQFFYISYQLQVQRRKEGNHANNNNLKYKDTGRSEHIGVFYCPVEDFSDYSAAVGCESCVYYYCECIPGLCLQDFWALVDPGVGDIDLLEELDAKFTNRNRLACQISFIDISITKTNDTIGSNFSILFRKIHITRDQLLTINSKLLSISDNFNFYCSFCYFFNFFITYVKHDVVYCGGEDREEE